jgi:hypothetical protein
MKLVLNVLAEDGDCCIEKMETKEVKLFSIKFDTIIGC